MSLQQGTVISLILLSIFFVAFIEEKRRVGILALIFKIDGYVFNVKSSKNRVSRKFM